MKNEDLKAKLTEIQSQLHEGKLTHHEFSQRVNELGLGLGLSYLIMPKDNLAGEELASPKEFGVQVRSSDPAIDKILAETNREFDFDFRIDDLTFEQGSATYSRFSRAYSRFSRAYSRFSRAYSRFSRAYSRFSR
jgi:hypothetical protein